MANKHRGEYSFEADGTRWTLCFSADAIVNLEEEFDRPVGKIAALISDPETMRMKEVRRIFIVGMRDRNPDMDDEKARAVFRAMRPVDAVRVVSEAFSRAFDVEEDPAARPPLPDATPRPKLAAGGIGPGS